MAKILTVLRDGVYRQPYSSTAKIRRNQITMTTVDINRCSLYVRDGFVFYIHTVHPPHDTWHLAYQIQSHGTIYRHRDISEGYHDADYTCHEL
jgi:hypothetical protein